MTTRTDERVGDWESVPFAGGYKGLHELADEEFSGAVIAGPTRLFMLNGTVVGILGGDVEDFEDAAGTAREAPHEALPLLAVMQDRADEVRAKYYTEETAVEEVDRTLADGKFTGFVELSENVLSGDYYVVYHQGRSMSVAWVGSSSKLITDDEAFDQANGEVGIYEVKPVDITPIEVPEPEDDDGGAAAAVVDDSPEADTTQEADTIQEADDPAAGASPSDDEPVAGASPSDDDPVAETDSSEPVSRDDGTAESDTPATSGGGAAGGPPGSKAAGSSQGTSVSARERESEEAATDVAASTDPAAEPEQPGAAPATEEAEASSVDRPATDAEPAQASSSPPSETEQAPEPDTNTETASTPAREQEPDRTHPAATGSQSQASPEAESAATAADLETRSIPSLDPEKSASSADQAGAAAGPSVGTTAETGPRRDRSGGNASESPAPRQTGSATPSQQPSRDPSPEQSSGGADPERVGSLESELEERERQIADLEAELQDAEATTEDLRAERDRLQSELDEAREEIERLQRQLEEAQGAAASAGTRLSASEAISNTNLFVRYHSKGEATLESAHDGAVDRSAVEENIRLEYHTQFEADDAAVDGESFEAFLHGTMQYRYVDWLIHDLLYEIRDTGHENGMRDLYDAIPRIDRAELNGQVSITYVEDGEEHRSQERFDVVVRDRMGNPLIVANMNDSREPASEKQMTQLVRDGERVGNASETLAAAFLVTSSFFEPGALETAEEATSSGLFSRDKRESYVNLSRKDGYHLCLLEARNQEFHLAVPEL